VDPRGDEQLRPQVVEMVEQAGLDEFADEGEEPGAPPAPAVAAAVTSERTVEAPRESLEPTIIASEIVALAAWGAGVSSARAASASESTPTAGVAARPAVAAVVIGFSSALRRGAVFAHARMSRLFRQPAWCDALSPAEIRALRGLVAFLAVLSYAGVVIAIWDRAVASDRRRALASGEVARADPSTPPAVPVTILPKPIPAAPIAAPSVTPPRPAPAPAPAPAPTPLTTPVTAAPAPPAALPARAQARKLDRPPMRRGPNARRPPAARTSPSRTPSLAVGGSRSEAERHVPSAAVAAAPAPPAGAVAGESRLVIEPPAAAAAVDPLAADRSAVKDVLAAYRKSYNNLDAASASAIWEGVDERALRRAFSSLSHQNVSFERCDVRVPAGDRAVARCDGVLSYVPKFGDSTAQQRRMTWNMDFRRNGDHWMIVGVTAR